MECGGRIKSFHVQGPWGWFERNFPGKIGWWMDPLGAFPDDFFRFLSVRELFRSSCNAVQLFGNFSRGVVARYEGMGTFPEGSYRVTNPWELFPRTCN